MSNINQGHQDSKEKKQPTVMNVNPRPPIVLNDEETLTPHSRVHLAPKIIINRYSESVAPIYLSNIRINNIYILAFDMGDVYFLLTRTTSIKNDCIFKTNA